MKATLINHTEKIVKKYNTSFHIHVDEYKTFFEFAVQNRNYPHSFWYTLKLYKKDVKSTDEAIETGFNTYFKEAKADIIIETRTLSEAQNIEEVNAANSIYAKRYAEAQKAELKEEITRKALKDAERAVEEARKALEEARKAHEAAKEEAEEAHLMNEAAKENYNEIKDLHIFLKEAEERNTGAEALQNIINECREEKAKAREEEEEAACKYDEAIQNFDECLYELEEAEEAKTYIERAAEALQKSVYYDNKAVYYNERIHRLYNIIDTLQEKEIA